MKKAILYNTHMFALINNPEQYLKKLRHVLKTFRNRDDIILWWRPHPNTEVNIKQYRPEKLDEYLQIVDNYKSEGRGIYDDTPDLHRAIAWTDAYYGDYSSLVALYQATGKPVMLQTVEPEDTLYKRYLFPSVTNTSEDKILCISNLLATSASISYIDTATLKEHNLCDYPVFDEEYAVLWFSYLVAIINNKYYFIPRFNVKADYLTVYDEKQKKFEVITEFKGSVELLDDEINQSLTLWGDKLLRQPSPKFQNIHQYNDSLFITPSSYPAIVEYNLKTQNVSYHSDFITDMLKIARGNGKCESYAIGQSVMIDSKIYMLCRWADLLIEFDMYSHKSRIITISERGYGNRHICYDGSNIWLLSKVSDTITRFNPITEQTDNFNEYPEELTSFQSHDWNNVAHLNGYIYAVVSQYEKVNLPPTKINTATGDITIASELTVLLADDEHITAIQTNKDKLYIITDRQRIIEYSDSDDNHRTADLPISTDAKKHLHEMFCDLHNKAFFAPNLVEYIQYDLVGFIDFIKNSHKKTKKLEAPDGDSGQKIYGFTNRYVS